MAYACDDGAGPQCFKMFMVIYLLIIEMELQRKSSGLFISLNGRRKGAEVEKDAMDSTLAAVFNFNILTIIQWPN